MKLLSLKYSIITLFCVSFQQQISSFKKFNVADLEILFGQGFYTSEKHLVISTEKVYGMLSKLVPSIDTCNCCLQHQTHKLNVTNLWSFLHSTKHKYGHTKSTWWNARI